MHDEEDLDLSVAIKNNIRVVFSLSNIVGTFPYNLNTLKLSKLGSLWSFIVHLILLSFCVGAYNNFKVKTNDKIEFYSILLTKLLIIGIAATSIVLFVKLFTIGSNLKAILRELDRVHSYFAQLSCEDVIPNGIAKKQLLTVSCFLLCNLVAFLYRFFFLNRLGKDLTFALYIWNFITFTTLLQCTNLLDIVKHYLNIINIEVININNNQDKQHFINLYKNRICVLNNMLPENYLCRRKLKILVQLHFSLCKLCGDIINKTYSLSVMILLLFQNFHLTVTLYFILIMVLQNESLVVILHYVIYFHVWLCSHLFILVWIIKHCEDTKFTGKSLTEIVYHKIIYDEVPMLNQELTHFLDCICTHDISFRALELFEIDYTVLRHMVGAVITYGVILVQLSFTN